MSFDFIGEVNTYDNPQFKILAWHSRFTVTGTVVNGAFTNFVGDVEAPSIVALVYVSVRPVSALPGSGSVGRTS